MSESFSKTYVTSNLHDNVPDYDDGFIDSLRQQLNADITLLPISEAILAALAIGAHRPDIVPHLLRHALSAHKGLSHEKIAAQRKVLEVFRSVVMILWPFVGIPWCVPACLGIVQELRAPEFSHLLSLAEGPTRPELQMPGDKAKGLKLLEHTYANVNNGEVRDMLRSYWADFSSLTWTVVFGYSLAGTTATGVFSERETQLLLATAIAASGATRQAKSHLTAANGLGVSRAAVEAVREASVRLNAWNGTPIASFDL